MNELIGRQIDQYRIDALLGEGGMGAVYRALDLKLARPVALKVMHSQLARNQEFQQRFLQEARAAARLNDHPSIVPIYYFGEGQGLLFMVMAFVSGGSLSTHIQRLQKTGEVAQLREILALLAQVADALGYAHKKGVVHRDIKPSNVLIQRLEKPDREGDPPMRAIVTDFGLAKLLEGGIDTRTGDIMGTYGFMSPEQCLQKGLDGRSDIYSLGVMLYQLTTGRLPFDIQSPTDAVMKHLNEIPPAPRSVCLDLPEIIETIILKAIAKKPEERYQKAEEMVLALRETAQQLTNSDVTVFSGQRTVFSLVTHLQSLAADLEPSRMGYDLTPLASKDQLIIAQKDHTPRSVALDKGQLTIGRSSDNDIILDHPDVSRQHARLEGSSTGWQIVDLKSKNGTYLDGALLLAGMPEAFPAGKTLRIGPYFIHLRAARGQAESRWGTAIPARVSQHSLTGGTHLESITGQIGVTLRSPTVEVPPGNRVDVQVDLFNQGNLVDQFKLRILGLPPTWVSFPQAVAELMPGSTSTLTFNLHPPEDGSAKAGVYPYKLLVESTAAPSETVTIEGQVILKSFERFSIGMHPSKVPHGGTSRVTIHNEGNTDAIYSLIGRDPANEVLFIGEQGRIRVPAGGTVVRQLSVKAKKRSLLGSKRTLPFEVQAKVSRGNATSTESISKTIPGQMEVQPYIPGWVLPLLAVLLMVCLLGGGFGISIWNRSRTHASQTARALETRAADAVAVIAATQTQANLLTQTAIPLDIQKTAIESTSIALTAIAQGDDDNDGLSNQKELEIGTDPKKDDTDDDGLKDGEEVNQFGTEPKKKDTDEDGLLDGAEVNEYGTIPTKPDTDGDGILDGVEVQQQTNPLLPPTATPLPTGTTPPSATPIPSLTSTQTPTPTLTPTLTPTTFTPSNQTISFETFPNGTPINADLFLVGNEFSSRGILLAGAPETSYCSDATLAAVRIAGNYGLLYNFLTTARPGQINACNTIPVAITFISPVQSVTLTFSGASVTYTMKVYDNANNLLSIVTKDAIFGGGTYQITFISGDHNISRITFGSQTAITAIKEINYEP